MRPHAARERILRLDADRVVEPALDQVDLHLAPLEHDAVALALRLVDHPRNDRAALRAVGLDPDADRELVVKAEAGDVAQVDWRRGFRPARR